MKVTHLLLLSVITQALLQDQDYRFEEHQEQETPTMYIGSCYNMHYTYYTTF